MPLSRNQSFGLEVDETEVRAVLLRRRGRTWRVESAERVPVTGQEETSRAASRSAALRQLARGVQLRSPAVVLGLPARHSTLKVLELPPTDRRSLGQLLQFEAQQHLPFPVEQAEMDFALLGRPQEDVQKVVLAACDRGILSEYTSALRAGGLRPKLTDLAALGAANCFAHRAPVTEVPAPDGVVVARVGQQRTSLTVLQGGEYHSHRQLLFGTATLGTQAGWLDRLTAELRLVTQAFRASEREGRISRVLLTGEGALSPEAAETLSRHLRVECFAPNPWAGFELNGGIEGDPAQAAVFAGATGLALRAERALIDIDLSTKLSQRAVARQRGRLRQVLAAAAVAVLMAGGWALFRSRVEARRSELRAVSAQLAAVRAQAPSAAETAPANTLALAKQAALSRSHGRLWLELLYQLSTTLPEGVELAEAHFDQGGTLSLRGTAPTSAVVANAVSALRRLPLLAEVRLTYANVFSQDDAQRVQFQISCLLRHMSTGERVTP